MIRASTWKRMRRGIPIMFTSMLIAAPAAQARLDEGAAETRWSAAARRPRRRPRELQLGGCRDRCRNGAGGAGGCGRRSLRRAQALAAGAFVNCQRKDNTMAYEELKQRQSVMWGNGPYQRVTDTLPTSTARRRAAGAARGRPVARPRLRDRRGRGAGRRGRADVTGLDLAPVPPRDRAGARRCARPRDRLRRRRRRAARLRGRELRQGLVDVRDHVLARPRGRRPGSSRASGARRQDRARELDPDGRPGPDVQGDGAVPGRAAAEQPLRLGRREPRPRASGRDRSTSRWRSTSRRSASSRGGLLGALLDDYGPTKTLADSLGERRGELERDWVDFFETNYRTATRSPTGASTCWCSAPWR